jgi:uncharacterized protein (DUF1501 family)
MSVCVPYGEPEYHRLRPTLAVKPPNPNDPNSAVDLNGFFGFAPAMKPLKPAYDDQKLLVVHATGSKHPTRSHFDAQYFMEIGKPNAPELQSGWLGRHLNSVEPMRWDATLRAVGIATGLQVTLSGGPKTLPVPNLDTFNIAGYSGSRTQRLSALHDMYSLVSDPLKAAALNTEKTIGLLDAIDFAGYRPYNNAVYPTGSYGYALKTSAALIKARVGVEAIAIDLGGWDTHASQGVIQGTMANLMTNLANGLAAFHLDALSDPAAPNVTIVVMSEFGRRLAENGSAGTDHGHGDLMLVMGNHVGGGRVLTKWPGLTPDKLFEGKDLEVTIDYRDILAEIVAYRLGNSDLGYVFPNFQPVFRGALRGCAEESLEQRQA